MILGFFNLEHLNSSNLLGIALPIIAVFTLWRLHKKESLVIKTQYLTLVILIMSSIIIDSGINLAAPIYALVELGAMLFILITSKSFANSYFIKIKNFNLNNKIILIFILPLITYTQFKYYEIFSGHKVYLDVYVNDFLNNDFLPWSVSISILCECTLIFILLFIVINTILLVTNKQSLKKIFDARIGLYEMESTNRIESLYVFLKKNTTIQFNSK